MPDELIYCPACNHRLRLPAELLGQSVECPQCHAHFTAPTGPSEPVVRPAPQDVPASGPVYADNTEARGYRGVMLTAPAVCLLIVSALGGLVNGFVVLSGFDVQANPVAFEQQFRDELDRNPNFNPQQRQQLLSTVTADAAAKWLISGGGIGLAMSILTVLGSIAMLTRGMYWLALLGALAGLNPANCCCLDLNLPFAIWALIVLLSADGRAAFR